MIDRMPTCSLVDRTPMCSLETVPSAPLASWRPHRPAPARPPLPRPPSPKPPPAADRALLIARPWAQTILEALNGRRSWEQLADLFDPGQVNDIAAAAKACGFRGATLVGVRAQSPADGVV
ncbi:MAG: Rv3235 family protein, partial [Propionibacteriaceae bacterium]|nr:Rv3235 family protein [Propionibacteriaceae bacterium]